MRDSLTADLNTLTSPSAVSRGYTTAKRDQLRANARAGHEAFGSPEHDVDRPASEGPHRSTPAQPRPRRGRSSRFRCSRSGFSSCCVPGRVTGRGGRARRSAPIAAEARTGRRRRGRRRAGQARAAVVADDGRVCPGGQPQPRRLCADAAPSAARVALDACQRGVRRCSGFQRLSALRPRPTAVPAKPLSPFGARTAPRSRPRVGAALRCRAGAFWD